MTQGFNNPFSVNPDPAPTSAEPTLSKGQAEMIARVMASQIKATVQPLKEKIANLEATTKSLENQLAGAQADALRMLGNKVSEFSEADLDQMHKQHKAKMAAIRTKTADDKMMVTQMVDGKSGEVIHSSRQVDDGPDFKSVRNKAARDARVAAEQE